MGPPEISSSVIEEKIDQGESATSAAVVPSTPPAEVTWIVTPRRNPPGVTLATMSWGLPSRVCVFVTNGASRYWLDPYSKGSCPACAPSCRAGCVACWAAAAGAAIQDLLGGIYP